MHLVNFYYKFFTNYLYITYTLTLHISTYTECANYPTFWSIPPTNPSPSQSKTQNAPSFGSTASVIKPKASCPSSPTPIPRSTPASESRCYKPLNDPSPSITVPLPTPGMILSRWKGLLRIRLKSLTFSRSMRVWGLLKAMWTKKFNSGPSMTRTQLWVPPTKCSSAVSARAVSCPCTTGCKPRQSQRV